MKKWAILVVVFVLVLAVTPSVAAGNKCTTIQDGVLTYSTGHYLEGQPLMVGYDPYGYNYQAHMFNGFYANAYLGGYGFPPYEGDDEAYLAENPDAENTWVWEYRDIELIMKWSDEWLSNKDCNEDGKLDRGYSCDPENANISACEGAWLTNHQRGECVNDEGKTCKWAYFVKIVAVPEGANKVDGIWYTANGTEIGSVIWGAYAIILQISNDPCVGEHGVLNNWEAPTGFGFYK